MAHTTQSHFQYPSLYLLYRSFVLEPAHSGIVMVKLAVKHAKLLLHHVVGILLVLEHHLHQVNLALHEAASAQGRVHVGYVTGNTPTSPNSLQSSLHSKELV